jgi:hypothetical protein
MGAPALAGGSIGNAVGSILSGNYQSQVAKNNQEIAINNSITTLQQGQAAELQQGLATRGQVGAEKAAQASNGLDVNTGSAAAVRASTAALGTFAGATIRNNAARSALGLVNEADQFGAQSAYDSEAGGIGAAGALIGGAAQAGGLYNQFVQSGALPGFNSPTM